MSELSELVGVRFKDTVRNEEYEIVGAEETRRGVRVNTEAVDGPDFVDSHSGDRVKENIASGRWEILG